MGHGTDGVTTGSVVSADGTKIGYRRLGSGPSVILLHGDKRVAARPYGRPESHLQRGECAPDGGVIRPPHRSSGSYAVTLGTRPSPMAPCSRTDHRWPVQRPTRPKQENTRSATCRQPPPDETSALQATWPPSLTGASQSSRLPIQVRCPGSQAFHQRSMPIPSGGLTWRGDPNSSLTSPIRSMTTPATATPNQSGHHPEATRAPPSSAKSQCGGPPTESIPKTHDQPEEPHSKHFRPCGNNVSTGRSPIPPIRHAARGPTSDRQDAPPLAVSARTKDRNGVGAGRPRRADSTRTAVVQSRRSGHMRLHSTRRRQAQDRRNTQHTAESGSFRSRGRRKRRPAARVLPTVRAAPPT